MAVAAATVCGSASIVVTFGEPFVRHCFSSLLLAWDPVEYHFILPDVTESCTGASRHTQY